MRIAALRIAALRIAALRIAALGIAAPRIAAPRIAALYCSLDCTRILQEGIFLPVARGTGNSWDASAA
jgi:hypothetical protein